MATDRELHNWVSDKLHEAMGMSDRTSVDYLISLGKKSDSVDKYVTMLDPVLGELGNLKEVATEIWNKIPRKQKGENINRIKERIAIAEREENKNYQMLSDSEPEDAAPVIKPQRDRDKKSKKKKSKKNDESNSDNDASSTKRKRKKNRREVSDSEDEEAKRERDLRERDEFAERLKKRDKEHTRNLAEKSEKKAFEEARKRLQMDEKDQRALIPHLRDQARKTYVKKRKMEKVEELREGIEEEEKMFDSSTLSAREKLEVQYKKKVRFFFFILLFPFSVVIVWCFCGYRK